jgi:hypothetical protein
MSKSDNFGNTFFLFRKNKLASFHLDNGDDYGGERNKVLNPFAEYI